MAAGAIIGVLSTLTGPVLGMLEQRRADRARREEARNPNIQRQKKEEQNRIIIVFLLFLILIAVIYFSTQKKQ